MNNQEKRHIYLYDTTLRDGQQMHGVGFSTENKRRIATALDELGIDFIEGGWPGANPTDDAFFQTLPKMQNARFTAFGMTRRAGRSVANDETLAAVANVDTEIVCLVGKSDMLHVDKVLKISGEENLEMIRESVSHLLSLGREVHFDAEHFFDGYKRDPVYTLDCLRAAHAAGAHWLVLCDTNGGTLPGEIDSVTRQVCQQLPDARIGIHCHNDTGNAVANSLAAIEAGADLIQGTINGLGERCGNADLISLIPTLMLKDYYKSRFSVSISEIALTKLVSISRMLDEIINRVPYKGAPYVGGSAFAHKAGLHASAVVKMPASYEHIDPGTVGNQRIVPISNQAGRANLLERLEQMGEKLEKDDPLLTQLLQNVKAREEAGFSYDVAQASFELLALEILGKKPRYYEIDRYRVTVEHGVKRPGGNDYLRSEAVVSVHANGQRMISASESIDPVSGEDRGPVNALWRALAKDLGVYQQYISKLQLTDFKVAILNAGVDAVTRVLVYFANEKGDQWCTIGVSSNIVDASFQALNDAITYCLLKSNAPEDGAMGQGVDVTG